MTDSAKSIISFVRRSNEPFDLVVCVCNFTPVPRHNYLVGMPEFGQWDEVLNSDAPLYGDSGQGNLGGMEATPVTMHGQYQSINITLPPLGIVVFRLRR